MTNLILMIKMSAEKLKRMLELKEAIKKKRPKFVRQDSHKKAKLKPNWRKPRGLQSKMRLQKKGYRRIVKVGWRSPALVRGLNRYGLKEVLVNNVDEIKRLNPEEEAAVIASGTGTKKRINILKAAISMKIKVMNIDDPESYIKEVEKEIKERKEEKQKELKEKEKKEKEKKKIAEKKEEEKKKEDSEQPKEKSIEELVEEEKEKKEKQKKDQEKILMTKS